MLNEHGEFIPYGEALNSSGEIISIAGDTGEESPSSKDVIKLLTDYFIEQAIIGNFEATALVYDVRVSLPGSDEVSDAIAVALDHKLGYSVVVFKPYSIIDRKVKFGSMFVNSGKKVIFTNAA
jgi:hypothetical protein